MLEAAAKDAGLYLYDRRVWIKDAAWENSRWHTISYRAVDEFEHIYIFWKPGITKVDRSRLSKQEWVNWGSRAVWEIASVRSTADHDSKFPIELPRRAIKLLTEPGDNVVVNGPIWPNLTATIAIMGGEPRQVPLEFGNDGWRLDISRLTDRVDSRTRAVMINSPSNPTGWLMEREDQERLLAFCRKRDIWLISDEVYSRLVYDRPVAPSFIDIAEPEDRVIVVNSFSKTWCMTGWRLGWIAAPASLGPTLEKMIEFHYSCPAHFSQMAGIVAVRDGEAFVKDMIDRYRAARDLAIDRLQAMRRVRVHRPKAAFYAFFKVDSMTDSLETCKEILRRTRVGLAPGIAFGPEGEGYIRLCFASTPERLTEAMDRLQPMLD